MLSTPSGNPIVRSGHPASGVSFSSSQGAPEKHGMVTTAGTRVIAGVGDGRGGVGGGHDVPPVISVRLAAAGVFTLTPKGTWPL